MTGRFVFTAMLALSLAAVAGCAGPRSDAAAVTASPAAMTRAAEAAPTPAAAAATTAATTVATPTAPAASTPAPVSRPPSRVAIAAPPSTPGIVSSPGKPGDLACRSDADCVVKDVGSCCGYRPQCLNKDARTFPEQVKAKCASDGRVGTCGMLAVAGCECVQGKCAAQLQTENSGLVR